MPETKTLIPLKQNQIEAIFSDEKTWKKILAQLKKEVSVVIPDLHLKKNRDQVISLAAMVTSTKTYLDKERKKLTKGWRDSINQVNESWKPIEQELIDLKGKVRKPVTEWEEKEQLKKEKEQRRISHIQERIEALASYEPRNDKGVPIPLEIASSVQVKAAINTLEDCSLNEDEFMEFLEDAKEAVSNRLKHLRQVYESKKKAEETAAENETLRKKNEKYEAERKEQERKEAAEQKKQEREEKQRKQASENLRKRIQKCGVFQTNPPNSVDIEASIQVLEGFVIDASYHQEAAQELVIERDMLLQGLRDKLPKIKQAEKEAQEQEEKDAQEAAEKRAFEKQAEENRIKREEEEERAADQEHKRKINRGAMEAIRECLDNAGDDPAYEILTAIVRGKIPNISIGY